MDNEIAGEVGYYDRILREIKVILDSKLNKSKTLGDLMKEQNQEPMWDADEHLCVEEPMGCVHSPAMENILMEAQRIVNGQRQQDYGALTPSFSRIAGMWSAYLGVDISKFDVAHMMIMLKLSRNHDKYNRDSMTDVAGYAYCAQLLDDHERMNGSKFNGEY